MRQLSQTLTVRIAVSLIFLLFSPLLASSVFANVNVTGTTGLVVIPSADVLDFKDLKLGGSAGLRPETGKTGYQYFAQIGAFRGLEAGFIGGANEQGNFREGVFINLKYSLQGEEGPNPLRIAMGVQNLTSATQTDIYMVFSKKIKGRLGFSGGFLADFPGDRFRPMGILGLDFPIFEEFHLMVDGLAGESMVQGDAGAYLSLNQDFALQILGVNLFGHKDGKGSKAVQYGFSWKNPF